MKLSFKIPLLIGRVVLVTVVSIIIPIESVMSNNVINTNMDELSVRAEANTIFVKNRMDMRLVQLQEIASRARVRTMDWYGVVRDSLVPDVDRIGVLELGMVWQYWLDCGCSEIAGRDCFIV